MLITCQVFKVRTPKHCENYLYEKEKKKKMYKI